MTAYAADPEGDEVEITPSNDVDWFVLDSKLIIFQERRQRLVTLDALSSFVWQQLWGEQGKDSYPRTTIAAAAAGLASSFGYSTSDAILFVKKCIEQWSNADLIGRGSPEEVIASPRSSACNAKTVASVCSQFRPYWVSGINVYIEREHSLLAALEPVLGHLPSTLIHKTFAEVSVKRKGGKLLATDWSGHTTVLRYPEEVVAWVKLATLEAILAARPSLIAIHAAALSHGDDGVLLVGSSGSGKSTLAAYLNAHGYALIGEDVVLLNPNLGTISGLPFSFCIKEGSWTTLQRYYPCIDSMPARTRPDGKRVKYLQPCRTRRSLPSFLLKSIVFPQYDTRGTTQLEPITRVEALLAILSEALNDQHRLTRSGFRMLCQALSSGSVWRLHYCDLDAALRCLESLQTSLPESRFKPDRSSTSSPEIRYH